MSFFGSSSPAPFFRFVMEFTTWLWLFLAAFQAQLLVAQLTAIGLLLFSVISLAILNFPGDKQPKNEGVIGIAVPGKLRVILEVVTAFFGLIFSLFMLGLVGGFLQVVITVFYLRFDNERLSWMWGWQSFPPTYVTELHKFKKNNQKNKRNRKIK